MGKKRGRPLIDPDRPKAGRLEIRVSSAEIEQYDKAARLAGVDRAEWIRQRLKNAAESEIPGVLTQ